jgi:transcriptional regulator with XRE-family HTH domain
MSGNIGARVRQAREQRGLSLRDVAGLTKLSASVHRAIEQDDFASLPAGMYRKAYLRTIAAEVGLDPCELAADYERQYEVPVPPATPATETAPVPATWIEILQPWQRLAIVTLTAVATLLVVWFAFQPVPFSSRSGLGGQSPTELGGESPTESGAGRTLVAAPQTIAAEVVQDQGSRVASAITPEGVPLKIDLTTTGWCWVAVNSDGERVVYGLIEPGRRVVVEGRRRIALRLGDAGSVQLSINNGRRHAPGGDGEVVELEVTADDARILQRGASRADRDWSVSGLSD